MSSSSGKPNPLSTLLEVYTRDDSSRESVQISPEEARLKKDRQYTLLTGLPLKPYFERRTVRTQVAENIWTFEQPQGFFNVTTPIRMTVIRLADGRLWVHAPVAATRECRRLLDELGGEIAYIILPTTAFEHKVFVGGFARAYPKAKVWVCPGQWAWPVNLPPPFRVDGYLSDDDDSSRSRKPMPWANEIEQFVLQPPCIGIGPANEVVFFHKSTKTLLVTDLVVYIDGQSPSPVVDIPDLLKASYDDPDAVPSNTPVPPNTEANRRKGWARMALQILFLGPTRFSTFKLVERRLLVSPVIETFVYSKVPEALVEFVERVALRWKFTSIIPAHFNAPAPASPRALQRAFAFAYDLTGRTPAKLGGGDRGGYSPLLEFWERVVGGGGREGGGSATKYPEDDMAVLRFVNGFILKAGIARK
ncbi:protein isoform 1 [Nannochloropsis oceanica]